MSNEEREKIKSFAFKTAEKKCSDITSWNRKWFAI